MKRSPLALFILLIPTLGQAAISSQELSTAINQELTQLEGRRSAAVEAYKQLDGKLADYNSWCSTYGTTSIRNLLEFKLLYALVGQAAFPGYYIYSQDPYFKQFRADLDQKLAYQLPEKVDLGRCSLVEAESNRITRDPKQFNSQLDELSTHTSIAYQVLAGNFRLLEVEKETLLELRGLLQSGDDKVILGFMQQKYNALQSQTASLRARAASNYEFNFRVPLGPLETLRNKEIGFQENEKSPGFFHLMKRRVFYVNQARLAAAKLFEISVKNFSEAEAMEERFLKVIQEAYPPQQIIAQPSEGVPDAI